ncbi:MAG: KEOPS complex subunit Pcc1 [Candidatus Micrarchaeaceae archaeon]
MIPDLDYSKFFESRYKYKRSSIVFKYKDKNAVFEISAADPTALRASINSVLRDLQVIEAVGKIPIHKHNGKSASK